MDFVHTIEDEATRRLSYEGAMHELHTILAEGMITGEYINQDVPEEERIILGTTFVPSASYGPEWGDAEAWKMPGTVGPNSEITLVAPGGVSGVTGPDGRPKGINYSFVGIFVAIALLTLFIVGIVAVRRRRVERAYATSAPLVRLAPVVRSHAYDSDCAPVPEPMLASSRSPAH